MQHHNVHSVDDTSRSLDQAETAAAITSLDNRVRNNKHFGAMLQESEDRKDTSRIIERLTRACLQTLTAIDRVLKNARELPRQRILLTRATQALMLWNERHKVLAGELDQVLCRSQRLQTTVMRTLGRIAMEITSGIHQRLSSEIKASLIEVAGTCYSELRSLIRRSMVMLGDTDDLAASSDTSDSSSENDDDDGLQSHMNDLSSYVKSLSDLDSALCTPAIDVGAQTTFLRRISTLTQHHHYSLRIRDLFPLVESSVADLLGQSNYRRYWQLQSDRAQLEATIETNQTTQSAPGILVIEQNSLKQPRNLEDESVFHDSGIGTSIPAQTEYAKSHISSNVSAMGKGKDNLFPALSREAKIGVPFECSACGRQIKVTRSRLWKQHLIDDLKPYICIHEDCSSDLRPYPSRDAWIGHMERNHKTSDLLTKFTCPFCNEVKEGETRGILTHVTKHLEVIAAIVLPRNQTESADLTDSEPSENSNTGKAPATIPRDLEGERSLPQGSATNSDDEAPHSTRDVSPPPIAPAVPSFGSIPKRTPSISDASAPYTGKAPPTGPRALEDERPLPPGPATNSDAKPPPTGPLQSLFSVGAPPIPSGPRAHGYTHTPRTGPSSKQWINPNLNQGPESPKMNRSRTFVPSRYPGYRPESSSSDHDKEDA